MKPTAIAMLQMKTSRTEWRIDSPSRAPMKRPTSASPAYAKPSVKYENSISSCIITDEHASSISPMVVAISV